MTYFVMALAMVLGLTQCKKDQIEPQGERVHITLDVDGGNSNSKVVVNPTGASTYATVDFEEGDVIYVGYNNAYVGTLTYSDGNFSGDITISQSGDQPLHFYFLGGLDFQPDPSDISGNSVSVTISDQSSKYPVISYSPSNEDFAGEGSYSAVLKNKVSIMKFNVTTPSTSAICITGMNNQVTVNFATPTGTDNGFSYGQVNGGLITMPGVASSGASTWAIVLPQATVNAGEAYSADNAYTGTRPAIEGGIVSNTYYDSGIAMTVSTPVEQIVDLSTITSPYTAVNGDILINTLGTGVQISIADGATITLRSANINGSDNLSGTFHGLKCLGDATIILENNDNYVTAKCSSGGRAGIYVPQHKTLTFEAGNSSGRVVATGAGEAAGIGGYSNNNCGAIVINSGKVTGTAGSGVDEIFEDSYSAGIGSSAYKRCDGITINGGQVIGTAYAYGNAAGIGTGGNGICRKDGDSDGSQPAITISNTLSNYVKAQKGSNATYFIGGGGQSKCGIVTVGGTTYEDGDGNRGISSSTSLSYDFDVTGNTLIYMP